MVEGKEEQVESTPLEQPVKETPTPETQTKTFTQEEVDALITRVQADLNTKEYQGLQRVVSKKEQKIKELEEQIVQPPKATDDDLLQILIEDRKGKSSEYGEADPLIPKLETIISKRKQAQTQVQTQAYIKQADAVYKRAEEVYGEDDIDSLYTIRTLIRAGDFDLAEKKIAKAKPKEPNKEKGELQTKEENTFEKRLDEEKRKWMEEHGLLTTEPVVPSGIRKNSMEVIKRYSEGDSSISRTDYEKAIEKI